MLKFFAYKKCSSCRKAESFLEKKNKSFSFVDIVENPPSAKELKQILDSSGKPIKKLFNTSGQLYRQMGLKDKVGDMSEKKAIELLSQNGMLIKRPIAFDGKKASIGFSEEEYKDLWG